jgi:hypothetical protein
MVDNNDVDILKLRAILRELPLVQEIAKRGKNF